MAEYIEREAAVKKVAANRTQFDTDGDAEYAEALLFNVPAADVVEVRHGEWKKIKLLGCEPIYECSICEKLHDQDYNYCNNCGAKMRGGE